MTKARKTRGGVYFRSSIRGLCIYKGKRGNWWIDYYEGPHLSDRIREKTEALSKSEADKFRREKLNKIDRGERGIPNRKKVVLLYALAGEYIEYATIHKRSVRSDILYVKRIKDHFGDVPVHKITRADCEDFKAALTQEWQRRAWAKAGTDGVQPEIRLTTVNRHIGCLKRIFNWALDNEKVETNPAARVKIYPEEPEDYFLLSEEQEDRLLQAAEQGKATHLKPIIILALATAMRKDEILSLKWEQVDLERRVITLTRTKNGKLRYVPVNADAEAVLRGQLEKRRSDGIYVFPNNKGKRMLDFKTAWRCAKARGEIPTQCRFHDLRHTSVSRMVMRGVDPVTIGRMAGWTDSSAPVMLRRYTHLTGDHLQQAAKALERNSHSHYTGTNSQKMAEKGKRIKTATA